MTESPEWRAEYDRHKRFAETQLGKLYQTYEHALIDYWRRDFDDRPIDHAKLQAIQERLNEQRKAFVDKLKELAGV